MCAQAGQTDAANGNVSIIRKNRISSLFGSDSHEQSNSVSSVDDGGAADPQCVAHIMLYTSSKPRDRKKCVLTLTDVSQVAAVYPNRPELIARSTLIKMEGLIGDEELAGEWRCREGWFLMMPDAGPGKLGSLEMLKWLVGTFNSIFNKALN